MAHTLDRHYSDFGGLDTRTNRLLMEPNTCREGSKNWAWDFNDQLCKRYGFQHKTAAAARRALDTFEHKFRDIDTGESKSEILQVCDDGKLYRRVVLGTFTLTITAASPAVYYSVIYDETVDLFRIQFFSSAQASIGTVTFDASKTISSLVTDVNALAITGVTASNTGTGTALAYLMDTVVMEELDKLATDVEDLEVWDWEEVPYSGATVPFPLAQSEFDSSSYEGCSWQNLNNVIYITDGGFPMKYDGKTVYRAGLPKSFPLNVGAISTPPPPPTPPTAPDPNTVRGVGGFMVQDLATPSGGTALAAGDYGYIFRFGFKEASGAEYFGDFFLNGSATTQYDVTVGASENPYISVPYLKNGDGFPIYSCRVSGAKTWSDGGGTQTFNVDSGHNIKVGMSVMLAHYSASSVPTVLISNLYTRYFAAKVSGVTATSITVEDAPRSSTGDGIFAVTPDKCVLNAYYVPEDQENLTIYNPVTGQAGRPYGAFIDVFRTLKNTDEPLYYACSIPMPRISAEEYGFYDQETDADITLRGELDPDEGSDLPRACKYLADWQSQLVQAGRTPDPSLKDGFYPSWYQQQYTEYLLSRYTEAHLCDYQSIYWSDALTPEGFPQDGLHEFNIDSQFNDQITGIIKNKDAFFAFKDRSVGLLTGTLGTNEIQLEILEGDVGNVAHKVLQEFGGQIIFMSEDGGFYSVVAGRLPVPIGYRIQDFFKNNALLSRSERLLFKKARAVNFKLDDEYICYVPAGYKEPSETSALPDPGENSVFFVLDGTETDKGTRAAWKVWRDIHANGGIVYDANGDLLLTSVIEGESILWKQKRTGTRYDSNDHTEAVEFVYNGAWLTKGMPAVDKHWSRGWVSSIAGGFSLVVKQYANFLDYVQSSITFDFLPNTSSKKAVKKDFSLNPAKASGLSIGFENAVKNQDVKINGWEVELSADFDPGEPKQ